MDGEGPATFRTNPDGLIVSLGGDSSVMLSKRSEARSYDLYTLSDPHMTANPPPPPKGAAVLADGSSFYLSDPAELQAFWRRLGTELEPLEVADLLVCFQNDGANEHLIEDLAELGRWLELDAVKKLHGFTLPAIRGQGAFGIDFCTWATSWPRDPTGTVRRWAVHVTDSGDLAWTREIIGRKIRSPFYDAEPDTERER